MKGGQVDGKQFFKKPSPKITYTTAQAFINKEIRGGSNSP